MEGVEVNCRGSFRQTFDEWEKHVTNMSDSVQRRLQRFIVQDLKALKSII